MNVEKRGVDLLPRTCKIFVDFLGNAGNLDLIKTGAYYFSNSTSSLLMSPYGKTAFSFNIHFF